MVFNAGGKKALRTLTSRCKSIPVECLKCEYKRARRAARATIWVCGREISKFPLELVRLCQEPPERCWGPGCPVACFQIHHKGKETSNVTSSLTYLIHYIYVQWFSYSYYCTQFMNEKHNTNSNQNRTWLQPQGPVPEGHSKDARGKTWPRKLVVWTHPTLSNWGS